MNFDDKHVLWYKKSAEYWTQALPVGNGHMGAMIYGNIHNEKVSLNHDELWSGKRGQNRDNPDFPNEEKQKYFKESLDLVNQGKKLQAQDLLEKHFHGNWSEIYMAMGDIDISFPNVEYTNYKRSLDLKSGVCSVEYCCDNIEYKREYFASYPDKAIVMNFSNTSEDGIDFEISFQSFLKHSVSFSNNTIEINGECPIRVSEEEDYFYDDNDKGIQFISKIKIIDNDADVSFDGKSVTVKGAKNTTVVLCTETSFNGYDKAPCDNGKDYNGICSNSLNHATEKTYVDLKSCHIEDYAKLYSRVDFEIESEDFSDIPTDERLKKFQNDKNDKSLYVLLYNFGRYLLISSSREGTQPMNLQGIWNNYKVAPWRSNYTININTEMNYWPVFSSNLGELNAPLVKMIEELSVAGEKTAKEYYGAKGFVSHHNTDIWRMTHPVPGCSSWSFWNMSSGWFCRHLFEQYEYTIDLDFLKNKAYPIMKKAAEFYNDILVRDKDGYYIISPSTSPENLFIIDEENCAVSETTTMSMTIVKELFENVIKSAEILNINDSFIDELKEKYDNLLPFKTGSKGQLLEWYNEEVEEDIHHRHTSHLYGLFPADIITEGKTPDIFEACKKTLEIRGDDGTGWSLGWKINFWARLNDGNHALTLLNNQLRYKDETLGQTRGGGTYTNLFDAHPPFQIDGNFGAVSGITEMLLRSDGKKITLLPALPDEWKSGKITGLKAKGNITVDIEWENGKLKDYCVSDKNIDIYYNNKRIN